MTARQNRLQEARILWFHGPSRTHNKKLPLETASAEVVSWDHHRKTFSHTDRPSANPHLCCRPLLDLSCPRTFPVRGHLVVENLLSSGSSPGLVRATGRRGEHDLQIAYPRLAPCVRRDHTHATFLSFESQQPATSSSRSSSIPTVTTDSPAVQQPPCLSHHDFGC